MALRDRVKIVRTVKLDLTADDWQLYSTKRGVKACALRLNTELETCVNNRLGIEDTERAMVKFMQTESMYGAADTEPYYTLRDVLDLIYGDSGI